MLQVLHLIIKKYAMKKYIPIFITVIISGCSNIQHHTEKELYTEKNYADKICKKIHRHKSIIKQCRPRVADKY